MPTDADDIAEPAPADGPAAGEAAWRLDVLKTLAGVELGAARALGGRIETVAAAPAPEPEGPGQSLAALSLALSRVARGVRLTIAAHARQERVPRPGGERPAPERAARGGPARDDRRAAADAADEARRLKEARLAGRLRRSMACYIARTAVEAAERETPETEQLLFELEQRFSRGEDELDYAEIDVKAEAFAACRDLGVDPGPDWWTQSWGIEAPEPEPQPDPAAAAMPKPQPAPPPGPEPPKRSLRDRLMAGAGPLPP